ncbi:hypothetical protein NQ317_010457 [Molorchus minor]|uniref:Uncharacterized protein n=1 Tax=Molorchus minor TaxID=1323400 RepID=A0ABQ9JZU1_9CUCU|nr:hypothetical protein NQ317_010457 [Molorchus minor]
MPQTQQKKPSTPEGMAVAYGSLVMMALLPIFFGFYRSEISQKNDKEKDAAIFPIMASCALFALYKAFKLFSKEYINLLLTGGSCLSTFIKPHSKQIGSRLHSEHSIFHITFKQGEGESAQYLIDYRFSTYDVVSLAACSLVGAWYLVQKHWVANNLFGLAFAVNAVELLHLNNVVNSGLYITSAGFSSMISSGSLARTNVVFPQDILQNGLSANNFAMLGLGDIVIPGIFIALLLRFDHSLKRQTKTYFHVDMKIPPDDEKTEEAKKNEEKQTKQEAKKVK